MNTSEVGLKVEGIVFKRTVNNYQFLKELYLIDHSIPCFFVFFWLDFGLWQAYIQYNVARFYKPTIPQSPPSHLRHYSTFNNARLEFSTIFVPSFDPTEWCLKNGLYSGGLNPGPLSHEPSALTTRPRLLAPSIPCFNHIEIYFSFYPTF